MVLHSLSVNANTGSEAKKRDGKPSLMGPLQDSNKLSDVHLGVVDIVLHKLRAGDSVVLYRVRTAKEVYVLKSFSQFKDLHDALTAFADRPRLPFSSPNGEIHKNASLMSPKMVASLLDKYLGELLAHPKIGSSETLSAFLADRLIAQASLPKFKDPNRVVKELTRAGTAAAPVTAPIPSTPRVKAAEHILSMLDGAAPTQRPRVPPISLNFVASSKNAALFPPNEVDIRPEDASKPEAPPPSPHNTHAHHTHRPFTTPPLPAIAGLLPKDCASAISAVPAVIAWWVTASPPAVRHPAVRHPAVRHPILFHIPSRVRFHS